MKEAPFVSPSASASECAFEVDRLGFCEHLSVYRLLDVGVVFCILCIGFLLHLPVAVV